MRSTFFLGNSCRYCRDEHAGGVSSSAGLYITEPRVCTDCASVCSSCRNNNTHMKVEVIQSEGGDFCKAALVNVTALDRARAHKFTLCHKYLVCFLLLLQLYVNKSSSSWI